MERTPLGEKLWFTMTMLVLMLMTMIWVPFLWICMSCCKCCSRCNRKRVSPAPSTESNQEEEMTKMESSIMTDEKEPGTYAIMDGKEVGSGGDSRIDINNNNNNNNDNDKSFEKSKKLYAKQIPNSPTEVTMPPNKSRVIGNQMIPTNNINISFY